MSAAAKESKRKRLRLSEEIGARPLRASYDAAVTTSENANHWAGADALSANAAHSPFVRAIIRNRARYEFANNTYCSGMLHTYAHDVVGEGPQLEVLLDDEEANEAIERRYEERARTIALARKLRTAILTRKRDGAVFIQRFTNWPLAHPVKLDLVLIEDDQIATPGFGIHPEQITDGILFDDFGNPIVYHLLKRHPGEIWGYPKVGESAFDKEDIPADQMVHLFTRERPGQKRGVSEIAAALALFAMRRRYMLSVIAAAETAADIAGIIKSNLPPDDECDDVDGLAAGDVVDIVRRALLTLPDGHDISQFKAEQPTTTIEMFDRVVIAEIARVLNMPYLVAAGNAGKSNFASAQVDLQSYDRTLQIERDDLETELLNWDFNGWFAEGLRIPGYFPDSIRASLPRNPEDVPRSYLWIGREHADPNREASGEERQLNNLTTSLAARYARKGVRWRTALKQIAKEQAFMAKLGIRRSAGGAPADPDELDRRDEAEERQTEREDE